MTFTCAGETGRGGSGIISRFPKRGGVARVIKSHVQGSLSLACRSATRRYLKERLNVWREQTHHLEQALHGSAAYRLGFLSQR